MRAVVQRVSEASVRIIEHAANPLENASENSEGKTGAADESTRIVGRIGRGFLILVGVHIEDVEADARSLAEKIAHLRVWEDEHGKLNRSLLSVVGSALVVSNFTLYADCRKGRRPSFTEAAKGERAHALYHALGTHLAAQGVPVQWGEFGAQMQVALVNDGPITLLLDSRKAF